MGSSWPDAIVYLLSVLHLNLIASGNAPERCSGRPNRGPLFSLVNILAPPAHGAGEQATVGKVCLLARLKMLLHLELLSLEIKCLPIVFIVAYILHILRANYAY